MNEKPKLQIETTNLTSPLVRLEKAKKITEQTAQSIDNSEGLTDSALVTGLSKSDVNRSTSSS